MTAPALIRRAFLLGALVTAVSLEAAPNPGASQAPHAYLQFGQPDQAEGRRVLEQFRQTGIAGEYYLEFDLRVMPRRGDERVVHGRLWGGRDREGAVLRVELDGANGEKRRLLIQNGGHPAVWCSEHGTDLPRRVGDFEPLMPGVELTAFELQMPFIYWPDAILEGVVPLRGRPAHAFLFRPPAAWAKEHPEISGVRAYLDTQFNAPVQTELLDASGRVQRTLTLVDLQKIDGQYIVKSIDLRNEATRDKVRFQVTGAALGLDWMDGLFEPARLNEAIPPPAAARVTRFAP